MGDTREELTAYIRRCIDNARGDDLERAKMAFGNLTDAQLDEEYGQSGETCREILEGYQRGADKNAAALDFFDVLTG